MMKILSAMSQALGAQALGTQSFGAQVLGAAFMVLILTGCQGESSPESVTVQFWKAVVNQDKETLKSLVTEESRLAIENAKMSDKKMELVGIEVGPTETSGNTSSCQTRLELEGGYSFSMETNLRRESDGWKVDPKASRLDLKGVLGETFKLIEGKAGSIFEDTLKKGMEEIENALGGGLTPIK